MSQTGGGGGGQNAATTALVNQLANTQASVTASGAPVDPHNYAVRMGYGVGSSPGSLRRAGAFQNADAVASSLALRRRPGAWVARARPDFGLTPAQGQSTHRAAFAGEVRVGSRQGPHHGQQAQHVQAINQALTSAAMQEALRSFAEDAERVLGAMSGTIGVHNLVAGGGGGGGQPNRAYRLVLNCIVRKPGEDSQPTRFPISCNWAASAGDVAEMMADYFGFGQSLGDRTIHIPRQNPFLPRNAQDVYSSTHGNPSTVNFEEGSDFQFYRVTWAGLIVLNLQYLLQGNGVLVNSLLRSHTCFTGEVDGVSVLGMNIATETDCLFISLAVAKHFSEADREAETDPKLFYKSLLDWVMRDEAEAKRTWLLRATLLKTEIYQAGQKHVPSFDLRALRAGTRQDLWTYVKFVNPRYQILVVNEAFELLDHISAPKVLWAQKKRALQNRGIEQEEPYSLIVMFTQNHYLPLLRYANFDVPTLRATNSRTHAGRTNELNGRVHRERARRVQQAMQTQSRKSRVAHPLRLGQSPEGLQEALDAFYLREPRQLYPKKLDKKLQPRVAYYDIETEQRESTACQLLCLDADEGQDVLNHNYSQIPAMLGWIYVDSTTYMETHKEQKSVETFPSFTTDQVIVYTGYDCITRFLHVIEKDLSKAQLHGLTFYAHNGGRYDSILILRFLLTPEFLQKFRLIGALPKGSGFLFLEVLRLRDKARFFFGDTFYHLSASLDKLCRDHQPPHIKLGGTVDYDAFRLHHFTDTPEGRALEKQWTDYLVADVLSLAEIYERYRLVLFNNYTLDLTDKIYTSATLSKRIYLAYYYDPAKYPLYTLSSGCETFVRESYHGGRCEVFTHRYTDGPVYYYDFTSLYPYEMCKPLPYNRERKCTTTLHAIRSGSFFGFVQVRVRSTDLAHPSAIHPPFLAVVGANPEASDRSQKLCFPQFETYTTLYCFSEEIKYILDAGLPYAFESAVDLPAYAFKKGPVLESFSQRLFERKRVATSKTERQIAKVTVNSGYGFWGMRRIRPTMCMERVESKNCAELCQQIQNGIYSQIAVHGGMFMGMTVALADSSTIIPTIASAVTAYARITLHKLMVDIRKHGGKVLYCDTDSVITNLKFEGHPYFETLMGEHLGGLTNELEDWPEKCAEEYIALAPKMYALRCCRTSDRHKAGHKGFRNVEFEQMLQLWQENKEIKEQQMQFRFDKRTLYIDPAQEQIEYPLDQEEGDTFSGVQTAFASLQRTHVMKRMDRDSLEATQPKRRRLAVDSVETVPLRVKEPADMPNLLAIPTRLQTLTYSICS